MQNLLGFRGARVREPAAGAPADRSLPALPRVCRPRLRSAAVSQQRCLSGPPTLPCELPHLQNLLAWAVAGGAAYYLYVRPERQRAQEQAVSVHEGGAGPGWGLAASAVVRR